MTTSYSNGVQAKLHQYETIGRNIMNCVCNAPGFCERHGVFKNGHLHKLCQTRGDYFMAWENGHGPGQLKNGSQPVTRSESDVLEGPGTELSKLIAERGYKISSGCGCSDKRRQMDHWGPIACRERLDEIVGWLAEAAKKAGWLERLALATPGVRSHALNEIRSLVLEAIERSEAVRQESA